MQDDGREGESVGDAPPIAPGSELAGYRIETLIGRGGMGVVFRAFDLALERRVALKLLAPELATDVRFRERFLRESRLAASLDHPAIIPIYDAGEVAGQLYIAMRLVEGTDLKRLLAEEGVLEPARALPLLEQVADALDAAHERGLVHRDVKPSNVLVDDRGHCYLADFGLSRRLVDQRTTGGAGRSIGTLDYVSPEQIRGEKLDGAADIYSLGCLVYECIAGKPPFVRDSETAVVFAHLEEEPPTLPLLAPVIRKALAKTPGDRYASARELIEAARGALRPPRRRRRFAVALVALAAVVGGITIVAERESNSGAPGETARPALPLVANTVAVVDSRGRPSARTVALGGGRTIPDAGVDVTFAGGSVWLLVAPRKLVLRIDPSTRRVTETVRLPWAPAERLSSGGGFVWVAEDANLGPSIGEIDARTGRLARVVQPFDLVRHAGGLTRNTAFRVGPGVAFGRSSLWTTTGDEVLRVDPKTGRIEHHIPVRATWLVYADSSLWAANGSDGAVARIDPVSDAVTARSTLHGWLSDLAVDGGAVWVTIVDDQRVFKLSEDDLSVQRSFASGPDPERLAASAGRLWVLNTGARAVTAISETSGSSLRFRTGAAPSAVGARRKLIWVAAAAPPSPLQSHELEVRVGVNTGVHTDMVRGGAPIDEQVAYAICSNLLTYADAAGARGTTLVPEVATALPAVTNGGRTYTFRIGRGFRFSPPSNEPVTAETFRHTIERTLSPKNKQVWPYLPEIVGAGAYSEGRARHIAGISVHGDVLSITLLRPAGDFLTRLSMPVFCPVPLSVPIDATRAPSPIPSDGRYYVSSVDTHRVVLDRNPNYPGHRPRRPARVVLVTGIPTAKAVSLTNSGKLDYLPPDFSNNSALTPGGPIDRRWGPHSAASQAGQERYFLHPSPLIDEIAFNTRRTLFRSVRLRRAVAFAIDRPALARAYFDAPAASVFPAAISGYTGRHVYPMGAPDLTLARRLAGHAHRKAVLLVPCDPALSRPATIVRGALAQIGIAVRIVLKRGVCDRDDVARAFASADLMIGPNVGFGPTDRDPAPFLQGVLDYGDWGMPPGPGPWRSSSFRTDLDAASALSGAARAAAYSQLADRLDRAAPVVVYGAFQYDEFFSARVGCRIFQGFYLEVDLGALCPVSP